MMLSLYYLFIHNKVTLYAEIVKKVNRKRRHTNIQCLWLAWFVCMTTDVPSVETVEQPNPNQAKSLLTGTLQII